MRQQGVVRGLRHLASRLEVIYGLQPEMQAFKVFPPISNVYLNITVYICAIIYPFNSFGLIALPLVIVGHLIPPFVHILYCRPRAHLQRLKRPFNAGDTPKPSLQSTFYHPVISKTLETYRFIFCLPATTHDSIFYF